MLVIRERRLRDPECGKHDSKNLTVPAKLSRKVKEKVTSSKSKKKTYISNGSRTWHCLCPSHVRSHFCRRFGACAFSLFFFLPSLFLTLLSNLHYYSFSLFFFLNLYSFSLLTTHYFTSERGYWGCFHGMNYNVWIRIEKLQPE